MVKYFIIAILALLSFQSFSQYEQMAGVFVPPDSTKEFSLFFRLGRTQSLLESQTVVFNSLRGGFEIKKKYRAGLLIAATEDSLLSFEDLPEGARVNKIDVVALGGFFEFMVINNYRWEMSVPLQLGYGFTQYNYLNTAGDAVKTENLPYFVFTEIGFNFQYNFNNWAGFGVGLGVRTTSASDEKVSKYTRGPFYNVGFRFSVGGLYQSVFHKSEVKEMKKAYFEARELNRANKK